MDNRNNAIAFEKVTARDLTDAHRRCLCTAAAAQFGLEWQLWAKEPLENPHREEPAKSALQQDTPKEQPSQVRDTQPKTKAKTDSATESKVKFLTDEEVEEIKGWVKGYDKRDDLIAAFKKQFKIMAPRIADRIQFPEHKEFVAKYIAENPA